MTDNQAAQMVETLEKIEKHLQAIDWKFWDMHKRFTKDGEEPSNREQPAVEAKVDTELESLADIVNETPASVPAVKHTLKYPSIEILK